MTPQNEQTCLKNTLRMMKHGRFHARIQKVLSEGSDPTLTFFDVSCFSCMVRERKDPITAKHGPSSARQRNATNLNDNHAFSQSKYVYILGTFLSYLGARS